MFRSPHRNGLGRGPHPTPAGVLLAAVFALGLTAGANAAALQQAPNSRGPAQDPAQNPAQDPDQALADVRDARTRAQALLAWHQHLAHNRLQLQAGDVGELLVTVPRSDPAAPHPAVRVSVAEPIPPGVPQRGGLTVTRHFVDVGVAKDGRWLVQNIPLGLALSIEVQPLDGSSPPTSYQVVGPTTRGQRCACVAALAPPYPVAAARVLNAAGDPLANSEVAVELRAGASGWHEAARTDAAGRVRIRIRCEPSRRGPATLVVVAGTLLRRGSPRLYTTELPTGPAARAHLGLTPATRPGQTLELGDLRLQR